jgi:hypothetical protein
MRKIGRTRHYGNLRIASIQKAPRMHARRDDPAPPPSEKYSMVNIVVRSRWSDREPEIRLIFSTFW